MKLRFILFLIVLCLTLCACGGNQDVSNNGESSANETVAPENKTEPTDKGLFVTEEIDDDFFKLPDDFGPIELPDDELDDSSGYFTSQPVTKNDQTEPEDTQEETTAPTTPSIPYSGNLGPNDLPDDELEP